MTKTVGQVIRQFRKEKRWSLRELGIKTEISHSYLSQIEIGERKASIEIIIKVAEVLEVSKLYLFKIAGYLNETDILELVDENKRLREALEFYADEDNNRHKEAFTVGQFERMSQVAQDEGYLARKALEGDNNDTT